MTDQELYELLKESQQALAVATLEIHSRLTNRPNELSIGAYDQTVRIQTEANLAWDHLEQAIINVDDLITGDFPREGSPVIGTAFAKTL